MAKDTTQTTLPVRPNGGPNPPSQPLADSAKPPTSPAAPTLSPQHAWQIGAEAYLLEKGWEKVSEDEQGVGCWADPKGSNARARPTVAIKLPLPGGSHETIYQYAGEPTPWQYKTAEAFALQKQRDSHGEAGSPLTRLNQLEERHDKLLAALEREMAKLQRLTERTPPNKPTEMTKEIEYCRQTCKDVLGTWTSILRAAARA